MDEKQASRFFKALQADEHCRVVASPRFLVTSGEVGTLDLPDGQKVYLTSVKTTHDGDQTILAPQSEEFSTGIQLSVRPVVSSEGRSVELNLKMIKTEVDTSTAPEVMLTTMGERMKDDGQTADSVASANSIRPARIIRTTFEKSLMMPDRNTAIVGSWQEQYSEWTTSGSPVFSKVPYLERLFNHEHLVTKTRHHAILVTPRIMADEGQSIGASR
jgi:type II secretory pathway component GspD/PulD (secretin)